MRKNSVTRLIALLDQEKEQHHSKNYVDGIDRTAARIMLMESIDKMMINQCQYLDASFVICPFFQSTYMLL